MEYFYSLMLQHMNIVSSNDYEYSIQDLWNTFIL